MTISFLIFTAPVAVLYNVTVFMNVNYFLFQVAYFLYATEAVLDPIWFILTLRDLRASVASLVRCRGPVRSGTEPGII